MRQQEEKRKIFVVLTQTGAITSKVLHCFTKAEYNHVSISTEEDLSEMYSFARRWKYYPLCGGFVKESPSTGVFGAFPKTKCAVISLDVSAERYEAIKKHLAEMYERRRKYGYNWIGLFLVPFKKRIRRKRHYFCSEFVKEVLVRFGLAEEAQFPYITTPIDFLNIFRDKVVYFGKLKDYDRKKTTVEPKIGAA